MFIFEAALMLLYLTFSMCDNSNVECEREAVNSEIKVTYYFKLNESVANSSFLYELKVSKSSMSNLFCSRLTDQKASDVTKHNCSLLQNYTVVCSKGISVKGTQCFVLVVRNEPYKFEGFYDEGSQCICKPYIPPRWSMNTYPKLKTAVITIFLEKNILFRKLVYSFSYTESNKSSWKRIGSLVNQITIKNLEICRSYTGQIIHTDNSCKIPNKIISFEFTFPRPYLNPADVAACIYNDGTGKISFVLTFLSNEFLPFYFYRVNGNNRSYVHGNITGNKSVVAFLPKFIPEKLFVDVVGYTECKRFGKHKRYACLKQDIDQSDNKWKTKTKSHYVLYIVFSVVFLILCLIFAGIIYWYNCNRTSQPQQDATVEMSPVLTRTNAAFQQSISLPEICYDHVVLPSSTNHPPFIIHQNTALDRQSQTPPVYNQLDFGDILQHTEVSHEGGSISCLLENTTDSNRLCTGHYRDSSGDILSADEDTKL